MGKKLTIEYAKQFFKDRGCELLEEEYINAHYKMRYICICGEKSYITFNSFQQGVRCKECGYKKSAEKFKFTLEYAEQYFEDHGCKLLEKEYKNNSTKMRYRCVCGNISYICFGNFQQGKRCMNCSGNKKHTIEDAKQFFLDNNCELLEEKYIDAHTKMRYICSCGHKSKISFSNFQQGKRCAKCGGTEKYIIEFAKQCFEEAGCVLLETEYIDVFTLMTYRCHCKEVNKISFKNFRKGQRCKKCGIKKSSDARKHTLEYAEQYFEDHGCKLLEKEYKNNNTKMKYKCECGDIDKITFANFQKGRRCKKCGIKKMSGKNSPSYNPNLTDEERINKRKVPGYGKWVKYTYKKDNYTCQKCEEKKDKYKQIDAHHIESWGSCEEKRLDKDNGITFCVDCHHDFHKKYSYGNNTKEQLEEFLGRTIS